MSRQKLRDQLEDWDDQLREAIFHRDRGISREYPAPERHRRHLSMLFNKKPTTDEWHREIDVTASGRFPVSSATPGFELFHWAQLQLHTDRLLRKRKLSDIERDALLCGLIRGHENKVTALAACSHVLSSRAALSIVETLSDAPNTLEEYLQSFVAASHGSHELLSAHDEGWAIALITVHTSAMTMEPTWSAIEALIIKFNTAALPTNVTLRTKAYQVAHDVLEKVHAALNLCQPCYDWPVAVHLADSLTRITVRHLSKETEDLLTTEIPEWHSWTSWRPDRSRIEAWASARVLLGPLWTLLGPDFDSAYPASTLLSRLVRDNQIVHWMQMNDVPPGPGLYIASTPEAMKSFTSRVFEVIDVVCAKRGAAEEFFRDICLNDQTGLDQDALRLWQLAREAFSGKSSAFILSTVPGQTTRRQSTSFIIDGMQTLNNESYKDLRNYLAEGIGRLIRESVEDLTSDFLTALRTQQPWISSGANLAHLRCELIEFPWLSILDLGVHQIRSDQLAKPGSIAALNRLHQVLISHRSVLATVSQAYIRKAVLGSGKNADEDEGLRLIELLHSVWQKSDRKSYPLAALELALLDDLPAPTRAKCVEFLDVLSERKLAKLRLAIKNLRSDCVAMCRRLVRIAAEVVKARPCSSVSFGAMVRCVMATQELSPSNVVYQWPFTACAYKKYRKWVENAHVVLGGYLDLRQWIMRLTPFSVVLDQLSAIPGHEQAMHCIYTGWNPDVAVHIHNMLDSIHKQTNSDRLEVMKHVVLSLTDNETFARPVSRAVMSLSSLPEPGFQQSKKLTIISAEESVHTAAIQLVIWLKNELLDRRTEDTLRCLATALHLPQDAQLAMARDYFLKRVASLLAKAQSLEAMQMTLKRQDRVGVCRMLAKLGIEETSSNVEDEIMNLPSDLFNHIEQVDETTLDMHFPLNNLKELDRNAMGLEDRDSVTVRVSTDVSGTWESFCVHIIDPRTDWQSLDHRPIKVRHPASAQLCMPPRTQIGGIIMRRGRQKLQSSQRPSLTEIYKDIETTIERFGDACIVCNNTFATDRYRPTICTKPACHSQYLQMGLDMRLADIRRNPASVGLLLAAVQAAASTMSAVTGRSDFDLLPGRPDRLNDNHKLLTLLDSIPSVSNLKTIDTSVLRTRYSIQAELLLSWAINDYRGFLVEATGALKIPNMPNVVQFVLVDSPPEIASAFAQHEHLQPRQVRFHGTSMDRLYAILCQGLKVLSNTSLAANGAAHGSGIYLAEEPSLATGFSRVANMRATCSAFTSNHAEYVNKRVLLGIEYAGSDASRSNGIHVATDPTRLLLRYVFLLPPNFNAPIANHIVPAMQSNFHTLRTGARNN